MRSIMMAVLVLMLPYLSAAQASASSWANLRLLRSGQKIQVLQINARKVSGVFLSVSDSGITLEVKTGEQTIERRDVRIVRLMKNKHRLRNTLIGAGIGAGVGAGTGAASYRQKCAPDSMGVAICGQPFFSKGLDAAFGAAVGLVGGAAVGALWPTSQVIYYVGGAG
jgi:hypothetical protein